MDPPSASVSSSGHEIFGIHQSPGVEELWATSRAERWLLVDVGDAWAPLEPRWNPVGAPLEPRWAIPQISTRAPRRNSLVVCLVTLVKPWHIWADKETMLMFKGETWWNSHILSKPAMRNKWYAHSSKERKAAKATRTYSATHSQHFRMSRASCVSPTHPHPRWSRPRHQHQWACRKRGTCVDQSWLPRALKHWNPMASWLNTSKRLGTG